MCDEDDPDDTNNENSDIDKNNDGESIVEKMVTRISHVNASDELEYDDNNDDDDDNGVIVDSVEQESEAARAKLEHIISAIELSKSLASDFRHGHVLVNR